MNRYIDLYSKLQVTKKGKLSPLITTQASQTASQDGDDAVTELPVRQAQLHNNRSSTFNQDHLMLLHPPSKAQERLLKRSQEHSLKRQEQMELRKSLKSEQEDIDKERQRRLRMAKDGSQYQRLDSVTRMMELVSRFRARQAKEKSRTVAVTETSAACYGQANKAEAAKRTASFDDSRDVIEN